MIGSTWTEDYGFVPFEWVQNRDMGLGYGWSELQPDLAKLYEIDDIASKVSDQIRKAIDAKWLMIGVAPEDVSPPVGDDSREDEFLLFAPSGADAKALVAPLDLPSAIAWVSKIETGIEKDHPELSTEDVSPDASGEARRAARELVEGQVVKHRAAYDSGLVKIINKAIAIAAAKGYPGYEAFDAESYDRGDLDFSIGDRPVFTPGESDRLDIAAKKSSIISGLVSSGVPLAAALELAGYSTEVVSRIEKMRVDEARAADMAESSRQNRLFLSSEDGNDVGVQSNAARGDDDGGDAFERRV